jgi:hypothetical protein
MSNNRHDNGSVTELSCEGRGPCSKHAPAVTGVEEHPIFRWRPQGCVAETQVQVARFSTADSDFNHGSGLVCKHGKLWIIQPSDGVGLARDPCTRSALCDKISDDTLMDSSVLLHDSPPTYLSTTVAKQIIQYILRTQKPSPEWVPISQGRLMQRSTRSWSSGFKLST